MARTARRPELLEVAPPDGRSLPPGSDFASESSGLGYEENVHRRHGLRCRRRRGRTRYRRPPGSLTFQSDELLRLLHGPAAEVSKASNIVQIPQRVTVAVHASEAGCRRRYRQALRSPPVGGVAPNVHIREPVRKSL